MRSIRGSRIEIQNPMLKQLSPPELILARTEAFRQADYGFVFDSYHADSMFRQQFPERAEYIRYAWANLGKEFRILTCRILKEAAGPSEARVIYFMELEVSGQHHAFVELAWLQPEAGQWRYHHGQKVVGNELPCPLEQVDFEVFDQIDQKVIF